MQIKTIIISKNSKILNLLYIYIREIVTNYFFNLFETYIQKEIMSEETKNKQTIMTISEIIKSTVLLTALSIGVNW